MYLLLCGTRRTTPSKESTANLYEMRREDR